MMFKLILTISAYMIMSAPLVIAQQKVPKTLPATYYIEKNELQLSEAINKFRAKKGLGELQLSPSLSFVARTHLNDIRLNSKDQHGCNLNSWSDKGKWTPCCFNEKKKNLDLMTSKPFEIIGFKSKGFEIVIQAKKGVSANNLIDLWLNAVSTQDFLLNAGQWSNRNWQSFGISIYQGFASIWASEMPDRLTYIPLEKEQVKTLKADPLIRRSGRAIVSSEYVPSTPVLSKPQDKAHLNKVTLQESSDHLDTKNSVPDQHLQTIMVNETKPKVATELSLNQDKGTSYFLVHSSYTSLKDAMKTIELLKSEGCKNLVMIDARGKYRVALGIYVTEAAAKIALHKNYPHFDKLTIYVF